MSEEAAKCAYRLSLGGETEPGGIKLLTGDNLHISGGMAEIILPKDSDNLFSREKFAHFISRRSLSIGLNFLRMDLKNNSGRVRGILKSANV